VLCSCAPRGPPEGGRGGRGRGARARGRRAELGRRPSSPGRVATAVGGGRRAASKQALGVRAPPFAPGLPGVAGCSRDGRWRASSGARGAGVRRRHGSHLGRPRGGSGRGALGARERKPSPLLPGPRLSAFLLTTRAACQGVSFGRVPNATSAPRPVRFALRFCIGNFVLGSCVTWVHGGCAWVVGGDGRVGRA
jgi:hypothetical protein